MWGVCPSLSGGLAVITTAAAETFPTYEVIRKFNQTQVRDNTNHKSSNIKELRKNDKKNPGRSKRFLTTEMPTSTFP